MFLSSNNRSEIPEAGGLILLTIIITGSVTAINENRMPTCRNGNSTFNGYLRVFSSVFIIRASFINEGAIRVYQRSNKISLYQGSCQSPILGRKNEEELKNGAWKQQFVGAIFLRGDHLQKAQNKYGEAYKQLATGNDNLVTLPNSSVANPVLFTTVGQLSIVNGKYKLISTTTIASIGYTVTTTSTK